ncbi:hypothetical protein AB0O20_28580 [Streptomyces kronopolitis]|uniref:hypothetical protein n=1 Tax=Streptomyces kronopolitis TaxID=1612435 RepID=UPI003429BE17
MSAAADLLCFAAGAAAVSWALGRLEARREARAAIRAARLAAWSRRPPESAPLLTACCERWWLTGGRAHERTCRVVVEEVDGHADPS